MKILAETKFCECLKERVVILQFVPTYDKIRAVVVDGDGEIRNFAIEDLKILEIDSRK